MAYGFAINTSAGFVDTLDFYTARLKETITATLPANTILPEAGNGVYLQRLVCPVIHLPLQLASFIHHRRLATGIYRPDATG